jgi:hypothetical protein
LERSDFLTERLTDNVQLGRNVGNHGLYRNHFFWRDISAHVPDQQSRGFGGDWRPDYGQCYGDKKDVTTGLLGPQVASMRIETVGQAESDNELNAELWGR